MFRTWIRIQCKSKNCFQSYLNKPVNHIFSRYGFIHDKRLPDHTGRTEREQKLLAKEMNRVDKWVTMLKKEPDKYFKERAKNR